MVKFYCDKCGKEITDNINTDAEEVEAIDLRDNVVAKFTKTLHYCDECQYDDLTCGFKVGDEVITYDGRVGIITDICTCEKCKERGFYEPRVEIENEFYSLYITDTDKNNGFMRFYQIGNRIFGNVDEEAAERIKRDIEDLKCEIVSLEAQLNVVKTLKEEKESATT